jgi:hypothetical protein
MYDHMFACVSELDEVMVFKTALPAWLRSLFLTFIPSNPSTVLRRFQKYVNHKT